MLYQAVLNLLSNAVKYTPEGGDDHGRRRTSTRRKRKVIARISDTGVGIPPKDLPFVFDKFYRAEANNRMAKGTGLGLSLVKHIIETVHHGRIFVESQAGQGKLRSGSSWICASRRGAWRAGAGEADMSEKTILVADDEIAHPARGLAEAAQRGLPRADRARRAGGAGDGAAGAARTCSSPTTTCRSSPGWSCAGG